MSTRTRLAVGPLLTGVRIDQAVADELDELAAAAAVKRADLVRDLLDEALAARRREARLRPATTGQPDWLRLADYVRTARDEKGWSQADLAERAGIGLSTVQLLERGVHRTRMPTTFPAVERVLGWAPGTGRAVLLGAEPKTWRQVARLLREGRPNG